MKRIIHLTDMHTGMEGDYPLGVDLRAHFVSAMCYITTLKPDLLLLGGDYCLKEGLAEVYLWQKQYFDQLGVPIYGVPGNHDTREVMSELYDIESMGGGEEIFFMKVIGERTWLFLDTSSGVISDKQMAWVADTIDQLDGDCWVLMHHPPLYAGVPHMDDKYALQNRDEFVRILSKSDYRFRILCGHYHSERTLEKGNVCVWITPSLYLQIADQSTSFEVESYRPGFRIIDMEEDGSFRTRVVYQEAIRR